MTPPSYSPRRGRRTTKRSSITNIDTTITSSKKIGTTISYVPSLIFSEAGEQGRAGRGRRSMAEATTAHPKMGLLASGGAPNLHLIAGALCALHKQKNSFEVIGASGAWAVAGLLYAVPKHLGGPVAALEGSI